MPIVGVFSLHLDSWPYFLKLKVSRLFARANIYASECFRLEHRIISNVEGSSLTKIFALVNCDILHFWLDETASFGGAWLDETSTFWGCITWQNCYFSGRVTETATLRAHDLTRPSLFVGTLPDDGVSFGGTWPWRKPTLLGAYYNNFLRR